MKTSNLKAAMKKQAIKRKKILITSQSLINLLGVVYAHTKTSNGGDFYITRYGLPYSDVLDIKNWYDKKWFETHRVRLSGTSSVFRVPTKEVGGRRLQLVVKNNRVGEHVPLDTHTLMEFINAEEMIDGALLQYSLKKSGTHCVH